jgi:GNAT superfamily N-acetyltransferase
MSKSFSIRAVDATDPLATIAIADLHAECFGEDLPLPALGEGHWWLAWDGKKPAAFACLRIAASTPGSGYLARSGVRACYRGHGLQRRLITVRERKARQLGLTRMVSDTTDNPHSSNNLIAAGYRLFEPEYVWAFDTSQYWQKNLVHGRTCS